MTDSAENDVPVVAPPAEALIRELRAYHTEHDPQDEYGFNSEEIWQYRLVTFGYVQLFSDWYRTVGQARDIPPEVIGDPEAVGDATVRFLDEHPLGGTHDIPPDRTEGESL